MPLLLLVVLVSGGSSAEPRIPAERRPKAAIEKVFGGRRLKVPPPPGRPRPPRTPRGLEPCRTTLKPSGELPRRAGETVRYLVDVDGLSVGTVDFKIEKQGTYDDQTVTEYRSLFQLDALVAAFVPIKGQAASLVPEDGFWPSLAMNRFKLDRNEYEERVAYRRDGRAVVSKRSKNGKEKEMSRSFGEPVVDFVSGFYMLRRLPSQMHGCTILYGNQRAYTVWMKHDGREKVRTPVGPREADRYIVRYGSERSRRPYEGRVWLGPAPDRLPYRAEIKGKRRLEARIHLFETGR